MRKKLKEGSFRGLRFEIEIMAQMTEEEKKKQKHIHNCWNEECVYCIVVLHTVESINGQPYLHVSAMHCA